MEWYRESVEMTIDRDGPGAVARQAAMREGFSTSGQRSDAMGDKGGKKDKEKGQKQSAEKQKQQSKNKLDRQPKRKP
jgi:hypothetical protein